MPPLPRTAQDDDAEWRWLFEPTPSLPEELARMDTPHLSIADGCPDATAWDEDDHWFSVDGVYYSDPGALHTAQTIKAERECRELVRRAVAILRASKRYWPDITTILAALTVEGRLVAKDRFNRGLTAAELVALASAAPSLYDEQRAEYLLDWSPTIPDSERAA